MSHVSSLGLPGYRLIDGLGPAQGVEAPRALVVVHQVPCQGGESGESLGPLRFVPTRQAAALAWSRCALPRPPPEAWIVIRDLREIAAREFWGDVVLFTIIKRLKRLHKALRAHRSRSCTRRISRVPPPGRK